jgi:hypothetical protein
MHHETNSFPRIFVFPQKKSHPDFFFQGHDSALAQFYGNSMSVDIVYLNLAANRDIKIQDKTLDWGSNSALAWTCSPGSSPYHDSNNITYTQFGVRIKFFFCFPPLFIPFSEFLTLSFFFFGRQ